MHEITTHNAGLPSQYFVLKIWNGGKYPKVHTSKCRSYLENLVKD